MRMKWMSAGIVWLMAASAHAQVTQQWVARYNVSTNGGNRATALAVDGRGTVYVTGWSQDDLFANAYATVAYDAATGAQRWVARYNGPFNQEARAIAVDGLGTVYVTGTSDTVAYDAATGAQRWVARDNHGK